MRPRPFLTRLRNRGTIALGAFPMHILMTSMLLSKVMLTSTTYFLAISPLFRILWKACMDTLPCCTPPCFFIGAAFAVLIREAITQNLYKCLISTWGFSLLCCWVIRWFNGCACHTSTATVWTLGIGEIFMVTGWEHSQLALYFLFRSFQTFFAKFLFSAFYSGLQAAMAFTLNRSILITSWREFLVLALLASWDSTLLIHDPYMASFGYGILYGYSYLPFLWLSSICLSWVGSLKVINILRTSMRIISENRLATLASYALWLLSLLSLMRCSRLSV